MLFLPHSKSSKTHVAVLGSVSETLLSRVPSKLLRAREQLEIPHDQRDQDSQLEISQFPAKTTACTEPKRKSRPGLLVKLLGDQPPLRLEVANVLAVPGPGLGRLAALATPGFIDLERGLQHAGPAGEAHHVGAPGDEVAQELRVTGCFAGDKGCGSAAAEDLLHGGIQVLNLGARDFLDCRAAPLGCGVGEAC